MTWYSDIISLLTITLPGYQISIAYCRFSFKLIFVRELVLLEKWYQEANHTLNVCREVLKTSGFALGFQHFFKCPDGNIPEYSLLVFKFKLILFENWYCLRNGTRRLVTLLMSAGKC